MGLAKHRQTAAKMHMRWEWVLESFLTHSLWSMSMGILFQPLSGWG
jgi:hypothetical protein